MIVRRRIALLCGSSLMLQSLLLPLATAARADEDGMAGLAYFRLPFGGPSPEANQPSFGFRFDQAYDERLSAMASDAPSHIDDILLPPAFDVSFTDQGLRTLSIVGVDTVPMLTSLGFHGSADTPEDQAQIEQEDFWMYLLGGLAIAGGIGVGVCFAVDACGSDGNNSSSSSPTSPGGLALD